MSQLPFDPENPPDSPPPSAVQPLLWRLAVRVYRDHVVYRDHGVYQDHGRRDHSRDWHHGGDRDHSGNWHHGGDRDHGGDRVGWTRPGACRACRSPWPCYPRRMAERGLLVACRAPQLGRGATAYLDDLPGLD